MTQVKEKFFQLYFDDTDPNVPIVVYFPNNEVSDDTYTELMSDPHISKTVFEDDESFVEFVLSDYTYKEILLSSDDVMELYQKHIRIIECMHEAAKKHYQITREAIKTKTKKVNRVTDRLTQAQAGTLQVSRQNVKETSNVAYLTECKV